MKTRNWVVLSSLIFLFLAFSAQARPVRVIMLDFADETGGAVQMLPLQAI